MRTCFEITRGMGWPIKLEQRSDSTFRVSYGSHVKDRLDYPAAAKELGECIMHALACEGNLDNEE